MSDVILFLTLEYPPFHGGVGRMYQKIVRERPECFEVWTPVASAEPRVSTIPFLAARGWPRWRMLLATLRRSLSRRESHKILVGQILPVGTVVWLLSFFYNISYGVFVHGMDFMQPFGVWRRRLLIRQIFRRANRVFAANRNVEQLLVQAGIPRDKIVVVYPSPYLLPKDDGQSRFALRQSLGITDNEVVLVTVSRLVARKGHAIIFEALSQLKREVSNIRHVVIGDGPLRAILERIVKDQQLHAVQFAGEVSDAETSAWLTAGDIFIMTPVTQPGGDIEGVGIVFLEASAHGLPIIAARSGAVPEVVQHGRTGLLVEEGNVAETKAAIIALASDAAKRQQFGAAGRAFVHDRFSAGESARIILTAFNE